MKIYVLHQNLYGAANIEHKEVSVENALQDRRSIKEVNNGCKRMFPAFSGPIGYILKFVVLGNHRHFEFKKCRNKTVSSLVEQNRDYCSFNNKITIMMYLFTVPPGTFITLSEFCVKVHFYNP